MRSVTSFLTAAAALLPGRRVAPARHMLRRARASGAASLRASDAAVRRIVDIVRESAERANPAVSASPARLMFGRPHEPPALSPDEVAAVRAALAEIDPADFTLRHAGDPYPADHGDAGADFPIGYCQLAANADLDFSMFVLPPGKAIPIHNHPDMYVFTRVLKGNMDVDEFEVLGAGGGLPRGVRALQRTTSKASGGDVRVLTPAKGNIHQFRANDWTTVFDVSVPPYSPADERDCLYYDYVKPPSIVQASNEDVVYLAEVPCPDSYMTVDLNFSGQKIRTY